MKSDPKDQAKQSEVFHLNFGVKCLPTYDLKKIKDCSLLKKSKTFITIFLKRGLM